MNTKLLQTLSAALITVVVPFSSVNAQMNTDKGAMGMDKKMSTEMMNNMKKMHEGMVEMKAAIKAMPDSAEKTKMMEGMKKMRMGVMGMMENMPMSPEDREMMMKKGMMMKDEMMMTK